MNDNETKAITSAEPKRSWTALLAALFVIITLAVIAAVLWSSDRQRAPEASPTSPASKPIRVVMSAAFVSESGVGVYEDITKYLSEKSGLRVEFITGLSYGTISEMLASGAVDCGFICGYPYVLMHDQPKPAVDLLAAPVMKASRYKGQPKYYSDLIVHKDSPYKTLHDLKGRTYVYNDELSNSGYNMPRHRLLELGLTSGFFGTVLRSGSHEESIRMVATGRADASYVDSLVLDYDREKGLGFARDVRVLESLGPAGICPIAVSTSVPAETRGRLQKALVTMHEDPKGRKILDDALVDRFAVVEESNYDDIRAMKAAAEKANFTKIK
jgi:phosphonate transport system substrate-binding protein